jgi:hypothetical protein
MAYSTHENNGCTVLVGRPEGKSLQRRSRRRLENDIVKRMSDYRL